MVLARTAYRIGQGLRALTAWPASGERAAALSALPPRARVVFLTLPRADQRHHLEVYRRLRQAGCQDPEVLTAALLHDAGKVDGRAHVWLWQRTLIVLLRPWPAALAWLARPPATGWRRGFALHQEHPARGAALALACGCSPRVAGLIAAHQDGAATTDPGLALLQAADDAA